MDGGETNPYCVFAVVENGLSMGDANKELDFINGEWSLHAKAMKREDEFVDDSSIYREFWRNWHFRASIRYIYITLKLIAIHYVTDRKKNFLTFTLYQFY